MSRGLRTLLLTVGLLAATLLAYAPALRAGFIWNDADYVTAPELRSMHGLARIWFEVGATEQYYPFLHSAFWIQDKLWAQTPFGYHLLNILLHAAAACLLAAVLSRIFRRDFGTEPAVTPRGGTSLRSGAAVADTGWRVAWGAAFLFALHPVCVESVAWVSEEKNTLSLVFYLLAAWAYLRFLDRRDRRAYAWATLLFVIALLSKTTTATLPAALLVVLWWRRGTVRWSDARPLVPWFVLGSVAGLFSAYVERKFVGAQGSDFALNLLERTLLAGRVVWFYVGKALWPGDLIFIYPRWQVDAAAVTWWCFVLAVIGALVALWLLRRRDRGPLAAALFFGGSLFPVLGFFNVYAFLFSFVADHWQYLPCIGLIVLCAAGLARLAGRYFTAVTVLVLLPLTALTYEQSRMYADMPTFYRTTLERNPGAWMAHNNLGNLLREDGQIEAAIGHYQAALRARPDLAKAHHNLGVCYREQKRSQEAVAEFRRAVEIDPDYADAYNNLGSLLRELGRTAEALQHLSRAVLLAPHYYDARNNYGMALRDAGRLNEAAAQFEAAIQARPDAAPGHLNLALTYSLLGRDREARAAFERARALNPAIPDLFGR